MRDYLTGELFFRLVCLVVLSSVESFNWTAQPTNPTPAIKGQDVSLAWQYSLAADELLQSQTYYILVWKKLNQSTSNYDQIGSKGWIKALNRFLYDESRSPHLVIDKDDPATLHIKDVQREDKGTYKIEFILELDGTVVAEQRVNLTVLERPELDYASNNQDVCEDSMVTLYCNATGKPAPNINWTRVWENGTDSVQLPVEGGSYVMSNINRSSNGTYRCTAYNGVGDPVNRTVKVIVRYSAAIVRVVNSSDTVIEGDTFNLTCEVSGYPMPNVTWITVSNDEHSYGNILNFTNITRGDSGDYRCETNNRCGKESRSESINVFYPPDIVDISINQTVNESDTVVLNCTSVANPTASITWTRVSDNSPVTFPLSITGKQDEGGYRCTAENSIQDPARKTTYISVQNYHPIETRLDTSVNSVTLNETFNITCRAQANPAAKYRFYKNQEYVFNDTSRKDVAVFQTLVHERVPKVNYSCTPFNKFGDGPTEVISVLVLYAPETTTLTTVPSNRTVLRDSILSLNCQTDASPEARYHFYFNGTSIGNSSSGMFNTTVIGDGVYTCVPVNTVRTGDNDTVRISVVVAPSVEILTETATVVEGEDLVLTCNASGKPKPSVTWTKVDGSEVLSNTSSLTIVNVSRFETSSNNMIQYQCTASNGVGTPAAATSTINVYYAPSFINLGNETDIKILGQEVIFSCLGMGNPAPTVNWTSSDNDVKWISNLTHVSFKAEPSSSGSYLCTIKNMLGEISKLFKLVVKALKILIKITIINKNCDNDNPSEICKEIRKVVKRIIEGNGSEEKLKDVTVENCGCGSITAYLSLDFKQSVEIPNIISVIKEAAKGNGFGDLKVDSGSIQAISDDQLPSSTQGPSSTEESTTSGDDDNNKIPWSIIGGSAGGAIVLVVIVVVAWCVHHKRKCRRKGSKVCCSESEEQAFTPREDNDHGHVNNGYAEAGPRPTAMVDMSQHQGASVAPTYAVVDKSAKKGKMKDKKDEEKKPQTEPPQYSVVDKSKKKKKKKEEEPEATYAQVDMSKKSKKKAKPGEVLYADLGDFHQMQELPNVSTSPKALPPIKKPAPYVETQYADITQFLKGDVTLPDSNKSQGPAPGTQPAPVPENQESQEPGTSAKETSQASNPGGDGGPGHETNF